MNSDEGAQRNEEITLRKSKRGVMFQSFGGVPNQNKV